MADGSEEGRVGRFRRRFEGVSMEEGPKEAAFGEGDFEWMGEGAREEKIVQKEAPSKGKGGKKK